MNEFERKSIRNGNSLRYSFLRVSTGIKSLCHSPIKILILCLYFACVLLLWNNRRGILKYSSIQELIPYIDNIYKIIIIIAATLFLVILLQLLGTPLGAEAASENLKRIGFVNHAGEAPVLVDRQQKKELKNCTILEFEVYGLPVYIWENKIKEIESALNINIVKLQEGKSKRRILLYTVPVNATLPKSLIWKEDLLSKESFVLLLGESSIGPVTINLAKIPHILLGGSTGSGKSILLKVLLMQCIKKGAKVYISDFKGGVDFLRIWHQKCNFITLTIDLNNVLDEIINELEKRKMQLSLAECSNIDQYNQLTGGELQRIIFACDEVAEVLDKNGLSKGDKELVSSIESKLSTIARQGRAFGIHLILATQRPDATILSGQIRNNIDCRICGRADKILSQIILDNTEAAEHIPKDIQGRFIMHDGSVFQGYLIDERSTFN